ncbi:sulfatase [Sedimentisphaera salicampi]|uniref:sulfatase n=1 Tax=Sedimentisphaera salicampi TaxID=1941349 RepID=UPI000B9B4FA0|nr:sulfatase [Sedimentisphaera salicampi]OXU14028.1 Arylsulfatase [Sedimentisphaera salicampi]
MKRREFFKCIGAFGAVCLSPQLSLSENAAEGLSKPNIVLMHIDDLGWADVDYKAPHDYYETPNIDALKQSGMEFNNGYAAAALCSPTRAALMTGRYPARTGVTNFISRPNVTENPEGYISSASMEYKTPKRYQFLELEEVTIAEILAPAGYDTYHLGKWHLGTSEPYTPDKQGFEVQMMGECHRDYFDPYDCDSLPDRKEGEYLTDRLTDEAEALMRTSRDKGKPFFLHLAHHAVHTPIRARQDYIDYFKAKPKPSGWEHLDHVYAAMIKSVDDSVGDIISKIDELGISENTFVVFTSDNGGHQPVSDNTPLREGKRWPYEGGIREPWIFKWDGVIQRGSVCEYPICSIDVLPTLCDLAGVDLPSKVDIDGVNITPLLKQQQQLPQRDLFWYFPHYISDYTGEIAPFAVIRSGKWKMIRWYDSHKPSELYNLNADLSETNDCAGLYPEKVLEFELRIERWIMEVDAKRPLKNENYDDGRPGKENVFIG